MPTLLLALTQLNTANLTRVGGPADVPNVLHFILIWSIVFLILNVVT